MFSRMIRALASTLKFSDCGFCRSGTADSPPVNVVIWGGLPVTCLSVICLAVSRWCLANGLPVCVVVWKPGFIWTIYQQWKCHLTLFVCAELILFKCKHHLQLRFDDLRPPWCGRCRKYNIWCVILVIIVIERDLPSWVVFLWFRMASSFPSCTYPQDFTRLSLKRTMNIYTGWNTST